jgi:hypothetical protein
MLIYRRAIDQSAHAGEGAAWWAEVQAELEAVIAAPTTAAAAGVIAWWHQVCRDVGDTPARAASRIRRQATSGSDHLARLVRPAQLQPVAGACTTLSFIF